MKKVTRFVMIVLLAGILVPAVMAGSQNVTLLLVPREDGPIKVGMDVGARCPTLLLSYKMMPGNMVSLHGWSGTEWVNVSKESYDNGTFFPVAPGSAVIVGMSGEEIPEGLIPSDEWCPSVYSISTTEVRPLLHLLGRHYDFKYQDWKWFSENYRIPLDSINPEGINVKWYQRRLTENIQGSGGTGASDLQYLTLLRSPQLPDESVPEIDSGIAEGTDDETVPTEEIDPMAGDEILTNAAPEAVILGAGDAEEDSLKSESDAASEIADEPEAEMTDEATE